MAKSEGLSSSLFFSYPHEKIKIVCTQSLRKDGTSPSNIAIVLLCTSAKVTMRHQDLSLCLWDKLCSIFPLHFTPMLGCGVAIQKCSGEGTSGSHAKAQNIQLIHRWEGQQLSVRWVWHELSRAEWERRSFHLGSLIAAAFCHAQRGIVGEQLAQSATWRPPAHTYTAALCFAICTSTASFSVGRKERKS